MSSSQPPTHPPPEDPHEGSETDPPRALGPHDEPAAPPRRYEGAGSAGNAVESRRSDPTVMDRLAAASGPLALIAFFLIGFGTGAWYIAWIVFFVPAALHAWNKPWSSGK